MQRPTQSTFNFDMTTLNAHIYALQPKRLRTLFKGLLMTAAMEPRRIAAIDADGFVLLTAPIPLVATWANVDVRTIQRCRTAFAHLVEQDGGKNEPSEWSFALKGLMPDSAVQWFRELVEENHLAPRHFANAAPAFCAAHPGILQNAGANATPGILDRTSTCFYLNTAKLAQLAEVLKSLGVACSGKDWQSLDVDDSAVERPEAIAALADVLVDSTADRDRVFVVAAIARDKERPWSWFRSVFANGWLHSTRPTKAQRSFAKTMIRAAAGCDAMELMPRMTAEQAWAKLRATMAQFDYVHDHERFRAAIGPEIRAAARQVGLRKIADSNVHFQNDVREAFAAAWNDQDVAKSLSGSSR